MWEKSLSLFEQMGKDGILQDEDCYSGAIWACVGGVQWQKAVELLKLMKFEGVCTCLCVLVYGWNGWCAYIIRITTNYFCQISSLIIAE
jgi:hypothetical protein